MTILKHRLLQKETKKANETLTKSREFILKITCLYYEGNRSLHAMLHAHEPQNPTESFSRQVDARRSLHKIEGKKDDMFWQIFVVFFPRALAMKERTLIRPDDLMGKIKSTDILYFFDTGDRYYS